MPQEIRRIVFSNAEATGAVIRHGEIFNLNFPVGKIVRAKIAGKGEHLPEKAQSFHTELHRDYNIQEQSESIVLSFFDERSFEHKYYELRADFITAALVSFCLDHSIILPRKGKKTLGLTDLNLCLDIDYATSTPEGGAPLSLEE